MADSETQAQLNAVTQQCNIHQVYYLRATSRNEVAMHVRPEVRALPPKYEQIECVRAGLARLGLRLARPDPLPKPATTAELQMMLGRIHYYCDLGPYQLRARSSSNALITIPPTMRVKPLTRRQHRCAKEQVALIPGARLRRGIDPTVD